MAQRVFLKSYLKLFSGFIFVILSVSSASSQKKFSRYDSLRGSLSQVRNCYDVFFYDLKLKIDPVKKHIAGSNSIHYKTILAHSRLQIDLFKNLKIDSILSEDKQRLSYRRDNNVTYVDFPATIPVGKEKILTIHYSGTPLKATNPPWDGGFVWEEDNLKRPWVGVAVEGIGASLWWPNKDHLSEKPDSMRMTFEVPKDLVCISNGTLRSVKIASAETKAFEWFVHYPINNYNVTLNIAHYSSFYDSYINSNFDTLELKYHVLDYNIGKAKKHFEQVKPMLDCYEQLFGEYPFYKDGYSMVETPYYGMEHQGCISYGNNYKTDIYGWDYIIIHESAHEWFGNFITTQDHGALWIHESFATYAENLLFECAHGYDAALKYLYYQKTYIKNKEPIVGPLGVNYYKRKDSDMYYKGAWMLHTIRTVVNNDEKWFALIYGLSENFGGKIVNTSDIIEYFNRESGIDLTGIFNHYLYHADIPVFNYRIKKTKGANTLFYKWKSPIKDFTMPIHIVADTEDVFLLTPTTKYKQMVLPDNVRRIGADPELYINVKGKNRK
jgi:aminopeptidase N